MKNRLRSGLAVSRRGLAVCMALWLFASPAFRAAAEVPELPDAPATQAVAIAADQQPQALQITILDGEGALNNIRQRTAREPIVQVKDRNRKPVAGVLILFAINDGPSGAGASIGGSSTLVAVTDADGRAQIHGYTPNGVNGKFTITVTATLGGVVALAIIDQENQGAVSAEQGPSTGASPAKFHIIPRSKVGKALLAAAIAAAAAVLVLELTGNSGPQITAGAGSVTHP